MKQTEIVVIPDDWDLKRLGDICVDMIGGGTPSTSNESYWNGNIPWMTSAHILRRFVRSGQKSITKGGLQNSATHLVEKDNLLVATRVGIGKVAINKIEVTISQDLTGLIIDKSKAFNEYVYWQLTYNQRKIKSFAQGSTIKGVLRTDLAKLEIPLPSIIEQQSISEVLSTVDDRLDIVERESQRVERLKVGLMKELFDGKKWKVVNLSEVVEIFDNKRCPLSSMGRSKLKGQYPYCGANGIVDYINKFAYDGEYLLIAEDGGDYGKFGDSSYIMRGKFWVNNHAHVLKAIEEKTTTKFLFYILNFMDLTTYIVGSTRTKLSQKKLQQIQIPLPNLNEQQHIIEILKVVDKKVSLQQSKKSKLENIKKSLMNDLLTGKKRVTVTQ
ncbi:TPA: hypothetical protein HA361_01220 [Candidatus Woesearchaeota archaeon]|nr:hypothetical protein [Candidatus Woesearchaeota archaeon]